MDELNKWKKSISNKQSGGGHAMCAPTPDFAPRQGGHVIFKFQNFRKFLTKWEILQNVILVHWCHSGIFLI